METTLTGTSSSSKPVLAPYDQLAKKLNRLEGRIQTAISELEAKGSDPAAISVCCCLKISHGLFAQMAPALEALRPMPGSDLHGAARAFSSQHAQKLEVLSKTLKIAQDALQAWPSTSLSADERRAIDAVITKEAKALDGLRSYLHQFLTFDLSATPAITDAEALQRLAEMPYGIKRVNLRGCKELSASTLTRIAEKCEGITALNLNDTKAIDALSAFLPRCRRLTVLGLRSVPASDEMVRAFLDRCASDPNSMILLNIWGTLATPSTIVASFSRLPDNHFSDIRLERSLCTPEVLRAILPKCQDNSLTIENNPDGSDAFIRLLLPKVKDNSFMGSQLYLKDSKLSDLEVRALAGKYHPGVITYVSLANVKITSETMDCILSRVSPNGLNTVDLSSTGLPDEIVNKVANSCRGLTSLNLMDLYLSVATVLNFAQRCEDDRLEYLAVYTNCETVVEAFIYKLNRAKYSYHFGGLGNQSPALVRLCARLQPNKDGGCQLL